MHPEYIAVYAIMQDRIRAAETQRRASVRPARPPRSSRRRTGIRRRSGASKVGEAA